MASNSGDSIFIGPKPTKACVNCRRQKAAVIREPINLRSVSDRRLSSNDPASVLGRLEKIEALLGIRPSSKAPALSSPSSSADPGPSTIPEVDGFDEPELSGLQPAVFRLKRTVRQPQNDKVWVPAVVRQLWTSFNENVPGLHFLSKKQDLSSPTPLLLASVLYVSALHHPSADVACLAPDYYTLTCSAIADLSLPSAATVEPSDDPLNGEQRAFQDVLGLILAGLVCEAFIKETGIWISVGYRLLLDHCPAKIDNRSREWLGLFRGLQIIDLEHASLNMSFPILPRKAPLDSLLQLQSSGGDPYDHLSQMMHIGLSRFTGRGIPTIWSFLFKNQAEAAAQSSTPFTETDLGVIRHWARQLDDWLMRYSGVNRPSAIENPDLAMFRQYVLQRLFVLSIYHPARGFNMFARNIAFGERQELLVSARAAMRLHNNDHGIWSNWDLVMITWAALLVLQGLEDGAGEPDDLHLIQCHLVTLRTTSQPPPSLRHQLAARLQGDLQRLRSPATSPSSTHNPVVAAEAQQQALDPKAWTLFSQDSIRLDSLSWQFLPKQGFYANLATPGGEAGPVGSQQSPSAAAAHQQPMDPAGAVPLGNAQLHPDVAADAASAAAAAAGGAPVAPEQWPPALMRLFGTNDFDMDTEHADVGMGERM
ncbi:hypothetical protein IWX90DRAFT_488309 [Phyllosticta citrichinensis]|uniref:Transcription factor domain-containing protein n=1 Tax=Phyllosticta citrichinensis TaxID=1130410 RepID=A0ABR1XNL7_9PEZI